MGKRSYKKEIKYMQEIIKLNEAHLYEMKKWRDRYNEDFKYMIKQIEKLPQENFREEVLKILNRQSPQ